MTVSGDFASVMFPVKRWDKRLSFCWHVISNNEHIQLAIRLERVIKGYEGNVIPITVYNLFNPITSGVFSLLNTTNQ